MTELAHCYNPKATRPKQRAQKIPSKRQIVQACGDHKQISSLAMFKTTNYLAILFWIHLVNLYWIKKILNLRKEISVHQNVSICGKTLLSINVFFFQNTAVILIVHLVAPHNLTQISVNGSPFLCVSSRWFRCLCFSWLYIALCTRLFMPRYL